VVDIFEMYDFAYVEYTRNFAVSFFKSSTIFSKLSCETASNKSSTNNRESSLAKTFFPFIFLNSFNLENSNFNIGKIGIPDSILNKTTSLTKEEFELIKTHTTIGGEILKAHPLSDLVMDAVVHHHERIDGKGYPDRLEGDRIDFITRIISVSDTFDAITSVRPYKDMIPTDKAIILLNGQREKRYDDKVVTLLVDAVEKKEIDSIIGHCSYSRPMSVCKMCGPVIAINLNKKDGDLILCNVCEGKYKIHANGNNFELEYLSDQKVFVKPEIDYIQIDKIIEFCK